MCSSLLWLPGFMKPSASCRVSSFELVGHLERHGSSYQFLQDLVMSCVRKASNVQFALASVIVTDFTDSHGILTDAVQTAQVRILSAVRGPVRITYGQRPASHQRCCVESLATAGC